jgi:hypothetical protein
MRNLLFSTVAVLAGCGDSDRSQCSLADWTPQSSDRDCRSAIVLTERSSSEVQLSQTAVDVAYEQVRDAKVLDCAMSAAMAVPHAGTVTGVYAMTTLPEVTGPWTAGDVMTGVSTVDDLFLANGAQDVAVSGDGYVIEFLPPVSVYELAQRAEAIGISVETEPVGPSDNDIVETPDGLRISIGWGDCSSGCLGTHDWLVEFAGKSATITEEGGDTIPSAYLAQHCGG